jgi:hypothetical protein
MRLGDLFFVVIIPTFVVYIVGVLGTIGVDAFRRTRIGLDGDSAKPPSNLLGFQMRWSIESVGAAVSLSILGVGLGFVLALPEYRWAIALAIPAALLFFVWICHIVWPQGSTLLRIFDLWAAFTSAASLIIILPGK